MSKTKRYVIAAFDYDMYNICNSKTELIKILEEEYFPNISDPECIEVYELGKEVDLEWYTKVIINDNL